MYVLTVSFYSWELRICCLLKVDVSIIHICIVPTLVVLVPAKSLWAIHLLYQVIQLKELPGVLCLPATTHKGYTEIYVTLHLRERRRYKEKDIKCYNICCSFFSIFPIRE